METITSSPEAVTRKEDAVSADLAPSPPLAVQPPGISLKELAARLQATGQGTSYKTLSEYMGLNGGEVVQLLGAVPGGNPLLFPPVAVDVLAEFLPVFHERNGKKPQLPLMLREYLASHPLHQFTGSGNTLAIGRQETSLAAPSEEPGAELARKPFAALVGVLAPLAGLPAVLSDLATAVRELRQDREQGRTALPAPAPVPDRLLTAEQAAELLACNPRSVSRHVAPVLPRKWRESDVLRFIAELEPKV